MTNIEAQINSWTARDGSVRRYINNWQELAGFEVEYYKSGNLCGVAFQGETLSNRKGSRAMSGKVWLDADNGLHFDYHDEDAVTIEQKRAAIVEALTAQGVI